MDPTSQHRSTHRGPISDADTYDIIDDAVTALAGRRGGLWLGDDTVLIHLLASLIDQAGRWLPHAVDGARAEGATWGDIAVLLDTSPAGGLAAIRSRLTGRRRPMALIDQWG